jgi:hypothetical protein
MSKSEQRQKTSLLPSVRCLPEEKEQIVASARAGGLSTGEYLRRCALGRKITPKTDARLVSELSRLGGLQKHLYTQMKNQMTPELSRDFAETLRSIQKAIVAIDMGFEDRLKGIPDV